VAVKNMSSVPSRRTILVVEDEPRILQVISLLLQQADYQVLEASDGEAALSLLNESIPDLIISDVKMPGIDGFTLCEQVRANPDFLQVPFIFLTAKGERADIRRGMSLGADDYLTKPFEPEELLSAVRVRLARAVETKEAIVRASTDLQERIIRTLTHEFRSPLALVVGYVDLLEATGQKITDSSFQSILQGLHSGSSRLVSLVDDFLLLSKLETGAIHREIEQFPPVSLVPDLIVQLLATQAQDQANAKKISVTIQCSAPDLTVAINGQHLGEIARRLFDNAIKFSKSSGGRILITTGKEQDYWVLHVIDNGIGIRQEALAWIFEAFQQVDRDQLEQQGTGVGLAIVRGLVEAYGGRVGVESVLGQGSTFSVHLPLTAP
jgi:two-component system sensor histidine kinase/response regulator